MLCSILALVVTFPGGSANDLAKAIRDGFHHDVILVASKPVAKVPALDLDTSSIDNLNVSLRTKTPFTVVPGSEPVFSDNLIPPQWLPTSRGAEAAPTAQVKAADIREGKLSFATKGNDCLDLRTLSEAPFRKPVKVHWFLKEFVTYVDIRDSEEKTFLTLLAQSLAGTLIDNKSDYTIDLDPSLMRRRIVNALNTDAALPETSNVPGQAARESFAVTVLNAMTNKQLKDLLATQEGTLTLNVSGSLVQPATTFVQAMIVASRRSTAAPATATGPQRRNNPNALPPNLLQRVDSSRTATITIDTHFRVQVAVPILNNQGRPGGDVIVQ